MSQARHILEVKKKQIETNLLAMVHQVKQAMEQAMNCLNGSDKAACRRIVENDAQVNEIRRLIEQDCFTAIALHQPVAHDLRDIVGSARIAGELERTGDYASDIASIVTQMNGYDPSQLGIETVGTISSLAARMLDEVVAAFLEKDIDKAKKAAKLDDQLDAEHVNLVEKLFNVMQSNPDTVPDASRMLWISHNLERCGDRATNIAEHIVFILEAEVVDLD